MRVARPYLLDVGAAIALATAALLGAVREDVDTSDATRPLDALGVLLVCGMTLPLAARRVLPHVVVIVTIGCAIAGIVAGLPGRPRSARRLLRTLVDGVHDIPP
jgi:hypothetical protein